jgi:tRNA (guanine-N7-)-methyltransferase
MNAGPIPTEPNLGSSERIISFVGNFSVDMTEKLPTNVGGTVRRPSASFKLRRRSLSEKRQGELDHWLEHFGLDVEGPLLSWQDVFAREGDVVLDVGFGHGESTIKMALAQPQVDVIAVEVHTPGVVTLLDAVVRNNIDYVRAVHGDLLPFLDRVPEGSLAGIRVFFPDPWPKARQAHRRLLGGDVITALTDRLRSHGELHMATDMSDYAESIVVACADEARLTGGVVSRPSWRPLTRFEQRGLDAGRLPTDLVYSRNDHQSVL